MCSKVSKEKKGGFSWTVKFEAELIHFKNSVFNINQQFLAQRMCKINLEWREALLHVDFSENYECKVSEVVQIFIIVDLELGLPFLQVSYILMWKLSPFLFVQSCSAMTVAIWVHLKPIFELLKLRSLNVSVLHFFLMALANNFFKRNFIYLHTCSWNMVLRIKRHRI